MTTILNHAIVCAKSCNNQNGCNIKCLQQGKCGKNDVDYDPYDQIAREKLLKLSIVLNFNSFSLFLDTDSGLSHKSSAWIFRLGFVKETKGKHHLF